jgi:hypothetical protein
MPNIPVFFPNDVVEPIGPIDPTFRYFPVDPLPTRYYVLEQIKCKKNNQIWLYARSTTNLNDDVYPISNNSFNIAFKKWGKSSFVKSQIGVFLSETALSTQLTTTQVAVSAISKNNPSTVGNLPVATIVSGVTLSTNSGS